LRFCCDTAFRHRVIGRLTIHQGAGRLFLTWQYKSNVYRRAVQGLCSRHILWSLNNNIFTLLCGVILSGIFLSQRYQFFPFVLIHNAFYIKLLAG
jgi:hypothetical protein